MERTKRAENTSNIDTDPEDIKCTVIKKPAKFIFSEEEEADVEDNDYPGTCYTSTVAVLPRPPHHGGHTSTTSVLPQPPQRGEGKERFDTSSRDCSLVPEQPKYIRMQNGKGKSMSVEQAYQLYIALEELADLCTKVAHKTFKKKLTQYLSALGGHSFGNSVRRIFRQLGTNSVWSYYSLKGKKHLLTFLSAVLLSKRA
ncbi:hypothetical protein Pmani_023924 [Petrolisthes manimaculis]|uniref:Uncharacterized protein n=1 Tax=Petrolisthes manimaculis TaxID=1843537 RepID=A0AAE1P8V5_9EUCA|nr:hypothetical protein Pmani_023924 [Petrolisthes manimaculis]